MSWHFGQARNRPVAKRNTLGATVSNSTLKLPHVRLVHVQIARASVG